MIEYSTFRQKPEVSEYEMKLQQLELNLRGLSNPVEPEESQIKHRSSSREILDPNTRRILRLEERLNRYVPFKKYI